MKKVVLSLAIALFIGFSATATEPIEGEKKEVKTETSIVTWKGYKFTGSHSGTIALKSGNLVFDDNKLTGGEFVVDMETLTVTDLEAGKGKEKLEKHLTSDDFFSVKKHTTSTLVFKKITASGKNSYEVTGDLTIKGITKPITFDVSVYGNKATATLKVDRINYDVQHGSTLFGAAADKAIYDEFDLVVDLEF